NAAGLRAPLGDRGPIGARFAQLCAQPHDRYLAPVVPQAATAPRVGIIQGVELRDLPSVDELARDIDDPLAVDAARSVLARAREEVRMGADPGDLTERVRAELSAVRAPSFRRVLNATGVIVHTNLG